jgi:hypothetical protein
LADLEPGLRVSLTLPLDAAGAPALAAQTQDGAAGSVLASATLASP